jgi:tetratricopeptide (TPR) repeat protein
MRKKANVSVTTVNGIQDALPSSPPPPPPPPPCVSPDTSPHPKCREKDVRRNGKFLGLPRAASGSLTPNRKLFHRLTDKSIQKGENDDQKALNNSKVKKETEDNNDVHDDDPVIALFEARNKQRVRFCLENNDESKFDVEKPTAMAKESKDSVNNNDDIAQCQQFNIKSFMGRILFNKAAGGEGIEDCENTPIVWESNEIEEESPEVLLTKTSTNHNSFKVCFEEKPEIRAKAVALLEKARKAQYCHHKYRHAVKCYVRANDILTEAKYPDDHPLMIKTLNMLKQAHHVLSCFDSSAKIVKMGIKYEDQNDYIRALKMYTIAYRMRRDQISRTHPSLAVLLNILGSIQVKRGELKEAMKIYELALRDVPAVIDDDEDYPPALFQSRDLARAVTFREMGVIYEMWGDTQKALKLYHKSLSCLSAVRKKMYSKNLGKDDKKSSIIPKLEKSPSDSFLTIQLRKSFPSYTQSESIHNGSEKGEMEVFLSDRSSNKMHYTDNFEMYDSFFPDVNEKVNSQERKKPLSSSSKSSFADVEVALTFHKIAQLHNKNGHFGRALDAYRAALRGMKFALGEIHPNVAAILGNIGNVQKEMGDLDAAYSTYQDVLGIEVHRLGVSHPEVAISLHNVATIEAGRGNYNQALIIYQKVIGLQRRLFGDEHLSVATTSACMGEVYERLGDIGLAMDCYEETLRSKIAVLGRHDLQVARVLHKLGKMAFLRKEYNVADSFITRAFLIYRLNKIQEDHEWLVDVERDRADIDAALALGDRSFYEI